MTMSPQPPRRPQEWLASTLPPRCSGSVVFVAVTELILRWSGFSPETGTSRERRQLRRPPFLPLGCGWIITLATGAGILTVCFGWLFFGCAVVVGLVGLMERGIHLLAAWDELRDRRRRRPR
jgi:hypothetical protein